MAKENTAMLSVTTSENAIQSFNSFDREDEDSLKAFYNAITNTTPLKDKTTPISLEHVVLEGAQYNDTKTNEKKDGIRLVLVEPEKDKDGKPTGKYIGYKTSSVGVLNSLIRMQSVFGDFPWYPAKNVISVVKPGKDGTSIRTLEFA